MSVETDGITIVRKTEILEKKKFSAEIFFSPQMLHRPVQNSAVP
jgi:hypothetical protein